MERENIKFRLDSGREMYKRSGGKLGRKSGYRKSKEQKLEQYAGVIKLLKKGYPVSQYCQDLRCQNLNCYEIEERVLRIKKSPGLPNYTGGSGKLVFHLCCI